MHTRIHPVQCLWEGDWTTFWLVWMILAHSVAVARQVQTPIFSKIGKPKTARLVLPSGPLHPQGTGKHVVQSDLAQPVPSTLDTGNRLWRAH